MMKKRILLVALALVCLLTALPAMAVDTTGLTKYYVQRFGACAEVNSQNIVLTPNRTVFVDPDEESPAGFQVIYFEMNGYDVDGVYTSFLVRGIVKANQVGPKSVKVCDGYGLSSYRDYT